MALPKTTLFTKKKRPSRPHIFFRPWSQCILALSMLSPPKPSFGLQVFSSTVSPVYAAVGGSVTLSCHFILAPHDLGVLDIEWSIKPADVSQPETLFIWYAANQIFDNYDLFRARVQFVSPSPASGNASITISDLKMTDTNTYQCKVRKLPGIKKHIIHLNVLQRPAEPECYVEGDFELDHKAVFRCRSSQGSLPMWYTWSMDGTGKHLPHDSIVDNSEGDLFLTVTKELLPGTLVCTAINRVGMQSCQVAISVKKSAVVEISAAVVGLIVFIIIIIITILVIHNKRRRVESYGNEILEDELPPHKWLPQRDHQVAPPKPAPHARQVCNVNVEVSRCTCANGATMKKHFSNIHVFCFVFCFLLFLSIRMSKLRSSKSEKTWKRSIFTWK